MASVARTRTGCLAAPQFPRKTQKKPGRESQSVALAVIENAPARLIAMSSFASLVLVAALAVFVYVTVSEIVEEQTAYASKINISGQQRMLSQRAAFFATEYTSTRSAPDRNLAQESISRLRDNHAFLLAEHYQSLQEQEASRLSAELAQLFFEAPYELDNRIGRSEGTV